MLSFDNGKVDFGTNDKFCAKLFLFFSLSQSHFSELGFRINLDVIDLARKEIGCKSGRDLV